MVAVPLLPAGWLCPQFRTGLARSCCSVRPVGQWVPATTQLGGDGLRALWGERQRVPGLAATGTPLPTLHPSTQGRKPPSHPPRSRQAAGSRHSPGCHGGCCCGCPLIPPGSGRARRSPGCHPRSPPAAPPVDSTHPCRGRRRTEPPSPTAQGQSGSQRRRAPPGTQSKACPESPKFPSHLAAEASPFPRVQEGAVRLVGAGDDGTHGVLVTPRGGGQQREGCQRDVVLAAGQAVPVMAVGAEPEMETGERMKRAAPISPSHCTTLAPGCCTGSYPHPIACPECHTERRKVLSLRPPHRRSPPTALGWFSRRRAPHPRPTAQYTAPAHGAAIHTWRRGHRQRRRWADRAPGAAPRAPAPRGSGRG